MSDTAKRCDVLDKFLNRPDVFSAMADRIVELEAAVEQVRSLHVGEQAFYPNWDGAVICEMCNRPFPCPTIRALEETP